MKSNAVQFSSGMSFVIKGKILKHESLRSQNGDDMIPFDVTFKINENENATIVGNNETDMDVREIGAHKLILAACSPVFKRMFYGAMKETKDVILIEQSTADAFSVLIDYFYQVDINCIDMTVKELFDLVNLAERYDVPELMYELMGQMKIVPICMENLMDVADTALKLSCFELASSTLLMNCAKVFKEKVTKVRDRIDFMVAQHKKGDGTVALKLLSLVESLPSTECYNCHEDEKECLAGRMVPMNRLKEGLKVQFNKASSYWDSLPHCALFYGTPCKNWTWTPVNINPAAQTFHLRAENGTMLFGPCLLTFPGGHGVSTLVFSCLNNDQE